MRRIALAGLAILLIASCTSGRGTRDASSTTAPRSAGAGRAGRAALVVAGDTGLRGRADRATVTCSFPDPEGQRISVFAHAPHSDVTYRMWVGPASVLVNVDSGAGPTFRERNFRGAGVSAFDAARGAHLDARLTEASPTPGIARGDVGTITAVRGFVDCGRQTPGSAHVTVTGETATGRYDHARLDPVLVECYFADGQLTLIGIARSSSERVLMMVTLGANGTLGVEEAPRGAKPRFYGSAGDASVTLTPGGGLATGDVVERNATPAHRLTIDGDARCGTPRRS
jgi:hypothetical protein